MAVLVSAGGVALGWQWADPVIGLVITVAIIMILISAAKDVFLRLMDGIDPDLVEQAETTLAALPSVTAVDGVRMRWIGHEIHAEAALVLDPATSLVAAHDLAHDAEAALIRAIPRLVSAQVHAYPAHGQSSGRLRGSTSASTSADEPA